MTASLPLQFKQSLIPLLAAIPGVSAAYLGRYMPVGENETADGAVIAVSEAESGPDSPGFNPRRPAGESDGIGVTTHGIVLHVDVFYTLKVSENIDEISDPQWQAITNVFYTTVEQMPMVGGVRYSGRELAQEGSAARMRLLFYVYISTSSTDYTQFP